MAGSSLRQKGALEGFKFAQPLSAGSSFFPIAKHSQKYFVNAGAGTTQSTSTTEGFGEASAPGWLPAHDDTVDPIRQN